MQLSKRLKVMCGAVVMSAFVGSANAYMLDDSYVGGKDHGWGDVIGHKSKFNTHGLDVSVTGTQVTVDIFTNFWDDIGVYSNSTYNRKGIGVGDLLLSSSWNPYGDASNGYKADGAAVGTHWTYGIAVDNAYSSTGGAATFYQLSGATNADNLLNSEDFMRSGTYRNGQAVAVDEASLSTLALTNSASWSVSTGKISFVFDAANTNLLQGDLALHWAMLCGNDVIEGEVATSVPEPSTLALIGLGIFGLGFLRRRV